MATMFSDYELTATRLAELLTIPVGEYGEKIAEWHAADQRPVERRNYYRPTRTAIEELHRRTHRIEDLRARVDEWRLDALATSNANARDQHHHNVRATSQYLDQHGERQMIVFKNQKFDPVLARVRIVVNPHLFVRTDGMDMRIWLDCSETLREALLVAKCHVTLWAARQARQPAEQVEVIHSAAKRIVARAVLPRNFERDIEVACEVVRRRMGELDRSQELRR
jgi:hypothetical protein